MQPRQTFINKQIVILYHTEIRNTKNKYYSEYLCQRSFKQVMNNQLIQFGFVKIFDYDNINLAL